MTQKFDIPINLKIVAKDEATAEQLAIQYLRTAEAVIADPDIIEYDLLHFVSQELSQSCCC